MVLSSFQIEAFLLILMRTLGLIVSAPVLNSRSIPSPVKVAFAFWLSLTFWFVVNVPHPLPSTAPALGLAVASEFFVGLSIGFIVNVIILSIQSAGEMIDVQMGLSVANVLDPSLGFQVSIIGRLLFLVGIFFFISMNGHHALLAALHRSFEIIPLGMPFHLKATYPEFLATLGQSLWSISIQMALPIMAILLLTDFAFGIISRVAPQVNVFMLGFQVKPTVGLLALLFMLPFLSPYIQGTLLKTTELLTQTLVLLKP